MNSSAVATGSKTLTVTSSRVLNWSPPILFQTPFLGLVREDSQSMTSTTSSDKRMAVPEGSSMTDFPPLLCL